MAPFDDADDDAVGMGPPLPPDDRLWRHPSELAAERMLRGPAPAVAARSRSGTWVVALVAGLTGAALSTGVIALTGSLSPRVVHRDVVEKVALTPVVSSPMLRGEAGVAALAERVNPAVVRLDVDQAGGATTGSGVLYRDDGLLLTSAQIVVGATAIEVVLADGRRLEGHLLGADALTDVALVDVDAEHLPVAVLGTAEGLRVGAPTIAVGSPVRFDDDPTITTGIISALQRRIETPGGEPLHGMIQIDAPIASGSSGGALVDATGAVIGITTAVAADTETAFGFATPIDLARRVADQILEHGRMVHAWLGVQGTDLSAESARQLGVAGGAMVRAIAAGSPAADAGLREGDLITELDGDAVGTMSDLVMALRSRVPGDEVTVGYWRDGTRRQATTTITERR